MKQFLVVSRGGRKGVELKRSMCKFVWSFGIRRKSKELEGPGILCSNRHVFVGQLRLKEAFTIGLVFQIYSNKAAGIFGLRHHQLLVGCRGCSPNLPPTQDSAPTHPPHPPTPPLTTRPPSPPTNPCVCACMFGDSAPRIWIWRFGVC